MILVTGGAGLLGSELIRQLLSRDEHVLALCNNNPVPFSSPLLKIVKGSILDADLLFEIMQDVSRVYHCAGYVSFNADAQKLYKINVEGTSNVVNAAIETGIKKLVHVSSVAVLGKGSALINEEMQWVEDKETSAYARSKQLGELEVWRAIAEGLDAAIINPSIILGPGNWNEGSTAIFRSAYKSFPWYTQGSSGFVDVRDVANAMILLMHSNVSSERFIISGENDLFRNVFNMAADIFGTKRPHRKVTPLIASVVWRSQAIKKMFTGKNALVTRETANSAFAHVRYDNSKFLTFFPEFKYHSLSDTINWACTSLQQKLNNA